MHSLRAVFAASGGGQPPVSLRKLIKRLKVQPPLTLLRTVANLRFPENEVELFKSYDLSSDFLLEIANGIRVPDIDIPEIDAFDEARRLQFERRNLRGKLMRLAGDDETPPLADQVTEVTRKIRNFIVRRQAASAVGEVDRLPLARVGMFGVNDPIWDSALREDDLVLVSGPVLIKLPGYNGRPVEVSDRQRLLDVSRLLRPNSAERNFRQTLLLAESLVGMRAFSAAIEQYRKILKGGAAARSDVRKFVALRMAAAQNALADQEFNALSPDDPQEKREGVKKMYFATASILEEHDVNTENPLAQELRAHMENYLFLVDGGFSALGSPAIMKPETDKDAAALVAEARARKESAQRAIDAFKLFTERLESEIEEEIKVAIEISQAASAIDELDDQLDILEEQRRSLGIQKDFLKVMLAVEAVSTLGSIIATAAAPKPKIPETAKGKIGKVGGQISSGADSTARFLELLNQLELVDHDETILDLQEEALAMRRREAQRQRSFLNSLGGFVSVQIQKYLELSNRFEDFSLEWLRTAIRKAFQAEMRLAFERGTAKRLGLIDTTILNYQTDEDLFGLAQNFDINQLSELENEIAQDLQATGNDVELYLNEHDLLALARLQQDGEADFAISLYDVDRKLPGSPNVRIQDVAIEFPNEVLPDGGLTVTLTHRGVFFVRDKETFTLAEQLIPDPADLERAQAAFREGRNLTVKGVTFINADENRRQFVLPLPDPPPQHETRQGLEGYGLTGLWNLKINALQLDEINPANLTYVKFTFRVTGGKPNFDFELKVEQLNRDYEARQEDEQEDALDTVTFFTMRDRFQDELHDLLDGEPEVDLDLEAVMDEEVPKLLKAIIVQVVDPEGRGISGVRLTAVNRGASVDFELETKEGGFTEDLKEIPIIERGERFPVGRRWSLKVPTAQEFDIHDIRWFIVHEARLPEPAPE